MARLRQPGDPGFNAGDSYADQGYTDPVGGDGAIWGDTANVRPGEVNPQAQTPAAPPAVNQNSNRQDFQNAWMSSTGTMDDFMKSHPEFSNYVKPQGSSKDRFSLGGDEVLDLVGDVGGKNSHGWNDTGFNAQGVPNGPAGGGSGMPAGSPPGLFGSIADFSASQGQGGAAGKPNSADIFSNLKGLFPNGAFNQDTVNRRTEIAREDLQRQSKSRNATNKAALANRGLIGSGPEITAQNRSEESIAGQYGNAVSGIYANESDNADQRMMQSLQLAAGLSSDEARLLVDKFRAMTEADLGHGQLALGHTKANQDYSLGMGNLALGNTRAANDYSLGAGNLALDWSKFDLDEFIRTGELKLKGADIASGGRR